MNPNRTTKHPHHRPLQHRPRLRGAITCGLFVAFVTGAQAADAQAADAQAADAVRRIEAAAAALTQLPARACAERVDLVRRTADALHAHPSGFDDLQRALRPCKEEVEARRMVVALLAHASPSAISYYVRQSVDVHTGQVYNVLPEGAIEAIERRHAQAPKDTELFRALDLAYRTADPHDRRMPLLRRWHALFPQVMPGDSLVTVADDLSDSDPTGMMDVLEQWLASRTDDDVEARFWALARSVGDPERALRWAEDARQGRYPARRMAGHRMAARIAIHRGNPADAAQHLEHALAEDDLISRGLMIEVLDVTARIRPSTLGDAALRLCETKRIAGVPKDARACAERLLDTIGQASVIDTQLGVAPLPEDIESLRRFARNAEQLGRDEDRGRALARIVTLDDAEDHDWYTYGHHVSKHGSLTTLRDLVESARATGDAPPAGLTYAYGSALIDAKRPRDAIDLMLSVEPTPSPTGGDFTERFGVLSRAYDSLGRHALKQGDGVYAQHDHQARRTLEQRFETAIALLGQANPDASAEGQRHLEALVQEERSELIHALLAYANAAGLSGEQDFETARQHFAKSSPRFPIGNPTPDAFPAFGVVLARAALRLEDEAETTPAAAAFLAAARFHQFRKGDDPSPWVRWAAHGAEAGDPLAMCLYGKAFRRGLGVPMSRRQAREWQARAAAAGNVGCMYTYGRELVHGERALRDVAYGLRLLEAAAEAGDWWARVAVSRYFAHDPDGISRDPVRAERWLRELAHDRYPEAIGWLIYHDLETPSDP